MPEDNHFKAALEAAYVRQQPFCKPVAARMCCPSWISFPSPNLPGSILRKNCFVGNAGRVGEDGSGDCKNKESY
jgi:hypothetical protein